MSADEKYALSWSSHADHIKQAFGMILEASDFVDVTLSCEGKKIKAHRVILAACSLYFYDILKDNPCSHPTIVLRDVKYNNIQYLLKFMYCGEVQVPIEHFSSFLQTAEFLQVSGLTGDDNPANESKDIITQEDSVSTTEKTNILNTPLKPYTTINKRKNSADELTEVKKKKDNQLESEESFSGFQENDEMNDVSKLMPIDNSPNIQKLLNDRTYLSKETNPECECPICAKKFISIYALKMHMPFHTGETKCQICGQVLNRVDLLKRHMLNVHKINLSTTKKEK